MHMSESTFSHVLAHNHKYVKEIKYMIMTYLCFNDEDFANIAVFCYTIRYTFVCNTLLLQRL